MAQDRRGGAEKMALDQEMKAALRGAFSPTRLEIRNDSAQHAGHSGDDGSGESHWHVTIRADAFAGMGRVQRHRAVHAALGPRIMSTLHALALDIDV